MDEPLIPPEKRKKIQVEFYSTGSLKSGQKFLGIN